MLKKLFHFIQYHNFFSIGVMIIFFGTSISLAASTDLRENIFAQNEVVRSIDNTYIVNADLANFDMGLKIQSVVEDAAKYYVEYTYNTVELKDYVWQKIAKAGSIKVSKKELEGRDLGLFVADQLGQVINQETAYLGEIQNKEKKSGLTQKVVATEYSGLVGQFLSSEEKTFAGYEPVIPEVVEPETPVQPASLNSEPAANTGTAVNSTVSQASPPETLLTREEVRVLIQDAVRNLLAQNNQPAPVSEPTPAPTPEPTATPEPIVEPALSVTPEPAAEMVTPEPAPVVEPTLPAAPEPVSEPTPIPESAVEPTL